jgi:hypothetical protein
MATSKSFNSSQRWTAGALLFSGRPDPVWFIGPDKAHPLEAIWNSLPGSAPPVPAAPPTLGYRGCFLRHPDRTEWLAFAGLVTRRSGRGDETRRDPNREFERNVLATAPAGILPRDLAI